MDASVSRRSALTIAAGAALISSSAFAASVQQPGEQDMAKSNAEVCAAYLDAWTRKDIERFAALLHPDIHFKSPNAETDGRDKFLAATARFLPLVERIDTRAQFVAGDRAMFAYDFVCIAPIGISPTAELLRLENGLVRESEIYFDARPFEAFARAQAARAGSQ
ncbi:MAG: nuclear transport factor 2 family protein [Chthoniobacterales bacterium]